MIWKNIKWLFKGDLQANTERANDNFDGFDKLTANHKNAWERLSARVDDVDKRILQLEKRADGGYTARYVPYGAVSQQQAVKESFAKMDSQKAVEKAMDAEGQSYASAVEQLHLAQAASYKRDILQRDPIELFKEDRVPILTSKAITLMRWLADDYEDFLVVHLLDRSPQELLAIDGVGEKTVGYVQSVLGRHGLSLAGGV